EDAIEARSQRSLALPGGGATIRLEVAVEVPDQATHGGLGGAVLVGEGVELVHQAFAMNPAQAVPADTELTGVIAYNHGVGKQAMRLDAAPQRPLSRHHHRVRSDLEPPRCRACRDVRSRPPDRRSI